MGNKILVTGATGTIGSEVVKALIERDADIVVAGRNLNKLQDQPWASQVKIIELDYDKPETLKNALQGISKLFLVTPPGTYIENEVAEQVLENTDPSALQHIVRLSGMGAEKHSLFGNHQAADELLLNTAIDYTALKPNTFMQNFINSQPNLFTEHKIIEPIADAKMSFIDARDIAAVAAEILLDNSKQHLNKFYVLTGDHALTYHQVAKSFSKILNKKFTYEPTTFAEYIQIKKEQGVPEEFAKRFTGFYQRVIDCEYAEITPHVANILGRPATTIEQFVSDYKNCF